MLVTFEEPPYAIKVTALALPLPFPVPSSLARHPPDSPFILLPSPTRCTPGAEAFFPAGSHPCPRFGAPRGGAESWGRCCPLPGPAGPGGGGGGAAINMADISPPRRERQQ